MLMRLLVAALLIAAAIAVSYAAQSYVNDVSWEQFQSEHRRFYIIMAIILGLRVMSPPKKRSK